MFLELDQIARELDKIYLLLKQQSIIGMRLLPHCGSSASVRAIEKAQETLGVKFPLAFSRLVCKFDFGEFEVCNVRFGVGGNYAGELVRLNGADGIRRQMVARRGASCEFDSFCRGRSSVDFCLIAQTARFMRGCLATKSFAAGASRAILRVF